MGHRNKEKTFMNNYCGLLVKLRNKYQWHGASGGGQGINNFSNLMMKNFL